MPATIGSTSAIANSTTLRIGVTGHRTLTGTEAIQQTLIELFQMLQKEHVSGRITLLSSLAEGADRLAAKAIVDLDDADFMAVLPMPENEYCQDFKTEDSQAEFRTLLGLASQAKTLVPQPVRSASYEAVGWYIVDNCDLLVAIWDGQPARGRGGTGEVVAYGQKVGRPLYWIDSRDPGKITRIGPLKS